MDGFIDHLTLGMVSHLEKLSFVHSVTVIEKEPADKVAIASWEQRHGCCMPPDAKAFFAATDGIQIYWSLKVRGEAVPTGFVEINCLRRLSRVTPKRHALPSDLPTVADIENDSTEESRHQDTHPRFIDHCKAFLLDPCQGHGKVCLVFFPPSAGQSTNPDSGVWFQDRALQWHFLSSDLSSYLRLALVHLGLPYWQYCRTPWGPPLKTKQLMTMLVPERPQIME